MKNSIILFCLFSLMSFGCKKKTDTNQVVVDTFVSIAYSNSNEGNKDLLDPANPNGIKAEDIQIYYLENGVKRRVYDANSDLTKNFKIGKAPNNDRYYLSVAVSTDLDKTDRSTTYIQVDKLNFTDTLTAEIYKHGSITKVGKVWYNGVFKVDGKETTPIFNVAK